MAVLIAPGNGGNREGRAGLAEELSDRGLAVLLMDYRGYGGNPGTPTEEGLAADAFAATEALEALGYPPERTIYFGESLGTGVVAALQVRRPPAGMVLRSPFTELADVGAHHYPLLPVRLLLRDRFRVVEHLSSSRSAGDRDLRGSRHRGALGAEREGGRCRRVPGRTDGDQGCRPQRPGDVRSASRRGGRTTGPGRSREPRYAPGCCLPGGAPHDRDAEECEQGGTDGRLGVPQRDPHDDRGQGDRSQPQPWSAYSRRPRTTGRLPSRRTP